MRRNLLFHPASTQPISTLFSNVFRWVFAVALWGSVTGCATSESIFSNPVENNDQNLFVSACETSMGRGVDVCRFIEGSKIESRLKIYLPKAQGHEIRVRFQDQVKSFSSQGESFELIWKDIVGADVWDRRFDGPIQVLVTSTVGDRKIRSMGHAFLIVLKKGYNPGLINGKTSDTKYCELKFNGDATAWECF